MYLSYHSIFQSADCLLVVHFAGCNGNPGKNQLTKVVDRSVQSTTEQCSFGLTIYVHMFTFFHKKRPGQPNNNLVDKDEVSRGTTLLLVSCHKKSSFRRNTTRNFLFSAPLPTHLGFICTVSFRRIHHTQLVWRETKLNAFINCKYHYRLPVKLLGWRLSKDGIREAQSQIPNGFLKLPPQNNTRRHRPLRRPHSTTF